jgi:phosphoribosylanthranilate isomerase
MPRVNAKICGLNDPASIAAALEGGADYIGLVFYAPSPRAVTPEQAETLVRDVPKAVQIVGLFVDPDDSEIARVLDRARLDMIQLHGAETAERVAAIRNHFGLPVLKAVPIAARSDIESAKNFENVADMLLFDAKAPKSMENALPGGNGLVFDWTMLRGISLSIPWMLAGGLTADNVEQAVTISGARYVDTSSGVEIRPGRKDPLAVRRFLDTVRAL